MKQTLLLLFLAVSILFSCSKKEDKINPEASFSSDKQNYYLTETASFSNTSSNATSFQWDFGDNTTSTEKNPSHIYQSPGIYTVKLSAGASVFEKYVKVHNGAYSYQVRNETGISLPLSSFYYDGAVKDLINHGNVVINGTTDSVFTNREKIELGGTLAGKTFIVTESYPLSKFSNKILIINGSTKIYTGSVSPAASQTEKLKSLRSGNQSTTIELIK